MDKGFIAIEQAMPPGKQVAFEPALALMFAEHGIKHAPARCEKFIIGPGRRIPLAVCCFEHCRETIGHGFVWPKNAEVALCIVELGNIAQEGPKHPRIAVATHTGLRNSLCIIAKIRHAQIAHQQATIRMRIGAHAPHTFRGKLGKFRIERAGSIEEFFRSVALQPVFQ